MSNLIYHILFSTTLILLTVHLLKNVSLKETKEVDDEIIELYHKPKIARFDALIYIITMFIPILNITLFIVLHIFFLIEVRDLTKVEKKSLPYLLIVITKGILYILNKPITLTKKFCKNFIRYMNGKIEF